MVVDARRQGNGACPARVRTLHRVVALRPTLHKYSLISHDDYSSRLENMFALRHLRELQEIPGSCGRAYAKDESDHRTRLPVVSRRSSMILKPSESARHSPVRIARRVLSVMVSWTGCLSRVYVVSSQRSSFGRSHEAQSCTRSCVRVP